MPTLRVAQSSGTIDKCVDVQLMPFLAVVFTGLILILAPSQVSVVLVILPVLLAYARRSHWSVRRSWSWTAQNPTAGPTA
ncbi:hypothetical protein [Streptomyces sp. A1136]|uniref:hypothetical protein n=1 Tax=Streptomyces sp. A1136 TaxID=2563102 RepID=UPI00109E5B32|nr:hypothetical protein [Streptomyces sp. A1136]THA45671.1 hypothetical protein E6R62_35280 [Streptomyces sp. A1136]